MESLGSLLELSKREDRILGTLWGIALGDALGLPSEGLRPKRIARWFPGPLRHRFLGPYGMCSDDTEHACMLGQALLCSPRDPEGFARSLAWRLRGWLLGLPAGVGWATLRSILRLWIGISPAKSGVFSAGNGPAMRSPLLGVCLRNVPDELFRAYVRSSTRLTHTDPKAEQGALAIALAARFAADRDPALPLDTSALFALLRKNLVETSFEGFLTTLEEALTTGKTDKELASSWGLENGITGYIYHTAPMALFVWLRSPHDLQTALSSIIALGGDTDTTAAIVGGLVGAGIGASALPSDLRHGLLEWPRSLAWQARLAHRLALQFSSFPPSQGLGPLPLFWPGLFLRNLFFLSLVLAHGFRRLLPPY